MIFYLEKKLIQWSNNNEHFIYNNTYKMSKEILVLKRIIFEHIILREMIKHHVNEQLNTIITIRKAINRAQYIFYKISKKLYPI